MAKKRSEKPLPRTSEHRKELLDQVTNGDDRTCAIVATAFLEDVLTDLLKKRFIHSINVKVLDLPTTKDRTKQKEYDKWEEIVKDLFDPERPLGTFRSKIDMCLALSMIGTSMHRDLDLIRQIRNRFAHWTIADNGKGQLVRISFQDRTIASWCREMRTSEDKNIQEPREKFVAVFNHMAGMIIGGTGTMLCGLEHGELYLDFFPIRY
jgi:hypothetical protein